MQVIVCCELGGELGGEQRNVILREAGTGQAVGQSAVNAEAVDTARVP